MVNTSSSISAALIFLSSLVVSLLQISRQALKYAHPGHVVKGPSQGSCFFPPRAITCQLTSRRCTLATHGPHSHFEEALARDCLSAVRALPLPEKQTKQRKAKTQEKTPLDHTPLNMGPPGDRTLHTSTERTEDFRWIVDLS